MALFLTRNKFRSRIAITIVGIVLFFYLLFVLLSLLENSTEEDILYNVVDDIPQGSREYPILLWWTPFTGESGNFKKCGKEICFFTDQRKYFTDSLTRGLLFYGSDFKPTDLPLPRMHYHDWALLHEESPKNNYLFSVEKVMLLFNHTATFRRESDVPLTLQYLSDINSLISKKFFVNTSEKFANRKNLAPVVYVQSDCNTPSERDSYVEELAKYIPVDSYGKCLQNKELPHPLSDAMQSMNSEEFLKILSNYKFSLAFENAVCRDYITEKLWRPLKVGSVPVYYGSPAVEKFINFLEVSIGYEFLSKDWLPNPESAILMKNFENPKQLAEHLRRLSQDSSLYDFHLEHKLSGKVSNQRLIEAMKRRKWAIDNEPTEQNFIEAFECLVCERVADNYRREYKGLPKLKYQSNNDHYGCPKPVSPFTLEPDSSSWWLELYNKAGYEATALENLMKKGTNFTSTDFYQEVINLLESSAF